MNGARVVAAAVFPQAMKLVVAGAKLQPGTVEDRLPGINRLSPARSEAADPGIDDELFDAAQLERAFHQSQRKARHHADRPEFEHAAPRRTDFVRRFAL